MWLLFYILHILVLQDSGGGGSLTAEKEFWALKGKVWSSWSELALV